MQVVLISTLKSRKKKRTERSGRVLRPVTSLALAATAAGFSVGARVDWEWPALFRRRAVASAPPLRGEIIFLISLRGGEIVSDLDAIVKDTGARVKLVSVTAVHCFAWLKVAVRLATRQRTTL